MLPAGRHKVRSARQATDMLTYIGQFYDHDIDLTTGAVPGESADIEIPQNDPDFDPEGISTPANPLLMPFGRSNYQLVDGVRLSRCRSGSIRSLCRCVSRSTA